MMNPYQPSSQHEPSEMTILQKAGICVVIGGTLCGFIWVFVPSSTPGWFAVRLISTMFAMIPLLTGFVYGLANLIFGQEEF